ncbi:uncharacterized protein LOC110253042 [Exaiptasia diaphana]|uniref:F-box domain-containing protein n=1 Tax=Exaiptasia diaphana TaxID=2652724 RepID=A0A913Y6M5_EXADI|nr:uncharacterized protein LOC110253042 [Exaiptasia diaphana]
MLGQDVLQHIFSFLDVKSLCISSQVCQEWYEVSLLNHLWKSHCQIFCSKHKRPCHLGRAENWKARFTQLVCGKLYSRPKPKEQTLPSFEQLKKDLVPCCERFSEFEVKQRISIKNFIDSKGLSYVVGKAYYQHTKTETISFKKQIVLKEKDSGMIYKGEAARMMVGLKKGTQDWNIHPSTLNPQTTKDFIVFIQSTSVNRVLVPKSKVLYDCK